MLRVAFWWAIAVAMFALMCVAIADHDWLYGIAFGWMALVAAAAGIGTVRPVTRRPDNVEPTNSGDALFYRPVRTHTESATVGESPARRGWPRVRMVDGRKPDMGHEKG